MALTKCLDCGREISTAAPVCPQCGRPNAPAVAAPQAPAAGPEETLWHASPSWLLLLGKIIWLALAVIVLPVLLAYANGRWIADLQVIRFLWYAIAIIILWRVTVVVIAYARIRSTTYTVTSQRVIIETGIAEKKVE